MGTSYWSGLLDWLALTVPPVPQVLERDDFDDALEHRILQVGLCGTRIEPGDAHSAEAQQDPRCRTDGGYDLHMSIDVGQQVIRQAPEGTRLGVSQGVIRGHSKTAYYVSTGIGSVRCDSERRSRAVDPPAAGTLRDHP